ncbi:NHS-like protein 2 [Brachionichthys hirsutus]|uniref:NHS-like protein 2 n=1 Tax=Brachionichthys hirsutus TaxID=412623 RepID=UPI003604ADFD
MPFCKRTILPKDVCKPDGRRLLEEAQRRTDVFGDLVDVRGFTLCSVLRQLSDLSRHSVDILGELEGELVSVCRRSGALEGRVVRLQRRVTEVLSKAPARTTSGLEAEGGRRGGHGDGSHSSSISGGGGGGAVHFKSPWQQSVNVFGSWSRPECVEELHQQAQLNLQSLLQDFEEQLYDSKLTGQTFRHPSSQSSDDTSTSLSRSPVSLNNKRPDFIFLPASKQLYDDETASSVFGLRSMTDPSPSPSPSPCGSDRPPLGWSSNNSSSSTATSATVGPPVAEKPRWHLGRRALGHVIPLDVTGEVEGGGGGKFHGVDLLQHSPSPSPSPGDPFHQQPRSLEPVTDTFHQNLPLRKTHSDLDTTLPAESILEQRAQDRLHPGAMDHSGLLCSNTPSSSWNGPKGSSFSPGAWNEPYSYSVNKGPAVPPKQHSIVGNTGGAQGGVMLVSAGQSASSNSSSFASAGNLSGREGNNVPGISLTSAMMGKRSETEGAVADGGRGGGGGGVGAVKRGRERSARSVAAANAFKFRERSLSTPTDSGTFCFTEGDLGQPDGNDLSTGNGNFTAITDHQRQHRNFQGFGESYALVYPRGSSEDSASTTDTISVAASDYSTNGRLRQRSRSISLKKSKRKPPPPVRSVSLMKNLGEAEGRIHREGGLYRDGRPKSLHIPRDHFPDFQPDFLLPSMPCSSKRGVGEKELGHGGHDGPPSLEIQAPDREGETELTFPTHWQLGDWKNDPYRSLSGSSTATGTTVIECMKVRGSSESLLDSPSTSRATSPSQLSVETDIKASSPFRPPGLMSPSSGYSSQSETPTAAVPQMAGQGAAGTPGSIGCKLRPKIPERKSSLPSPKDPAARSRLSFEMPGNAHLELSSIRPKQKASRRHSDTSTAAKPGKISSGASQALPVVTQNELKTVRLRSVSRGDLEDCPDGASDTIEEEQHGRELGEDPSPPPTLPKPKPPVAVKPPLPKRPPLNLFLKSPSPSSSTSPLALESPPASPVDRPVPLGNIYKVMKKPKPKKPSCQAPKRPRSLTDSTMAPQTAYDNPLLPNCQALFDLPPLPDPQPLLEDAAVEPELDSESHHGTEEGGSLPSPVSKMEAPELQDKSKTLPSRMTISYLAELSDKKKPKVPPPVPKKPNVLLLPSSVHSSTNGSTERQMPQSESPVGLQSSGVPFYTEEFPCAPSVPGMLGHLKNHLGTDEESSKESSLHSSLQDSYLTELEGKMATAGIGPDDLTANEKTELHITEETEDDSSASTSATHTTEDLFTIIHRSKRKVLGRKEPSDSFGSRQSLVSPVKHSTCGSDVRNLTLGSSQRSTSRNENFMALLQKKGSKSAGGGARVSAMELLKSTNPLARRVTEFSAAPSTAIEGGDATSGDGKASDQ